MPVNTSPSKKPFRAIRLFTDREEPTAVFQESVDRLTRGDRDNHVLVYYGVGGIGKTKLLNELYHRTQLMAQQTEVSSSGGGIRPVFISLDIHEFNTPVQVLVALRNQFKAPCVLFDFALLKYWALVGHTPLEVRSFIDKGSIAHELLSGALQAVYIPLSLIEKVHAQVRHRFSKEYEAFRNDFDMIHELDQDPASLATHLPKYLGQDIAWSYHSKGWRHVLFIDSFESARQRLKVGATQVDPEYLFKELFGSSRGSLFVVAGRERLRWGEGDPTWADLLDQHILDALSPEDTRYFLTNVPIPEEDVREAIVTTSKGLPLYLDMCVTLYERKKASGSQLLAAEFQIPERDVVARFLNHLEPNEQELIKVLSLVQYFDYSLFSVLTRELNIGYPLTRFEAFTDFSFIREIDGLFKVHDLFHNYIQRTVADQQWKSVLFEVFLRHLGEHRSQLGFEKLQLLFGSCIRLARDTKTVNIGAIESLLEVGEDLVDNGYWLSVGTALDKFPLDSNPAVRDAGRLLQAAFLARGGDLESAYAAASSIQGATQTLGKFHHHPAYHVADSLRILGRIPEARNAFRELGQHIDQSSDLDMYVKVQRQIGDLTFIHGEFQKALTLLRPLADLTPKDGRARAETLRIIGHVYRFNMMLPDAERVYLESMRIADAIHAVGLKGELLNNLTETLAWKEPSRALQFGDESLKHNQSIAFRVEVGKTKAALAVAHALLGSMKEAHRLADEARNEQNTVGYLGGILVAEMAEFYIAVAERETQHARQQAEVARDIIHRMDSNFFLELPLAMGLNLPMPRDEPIHAIEWLELDQTIHVWEDFFARLSSQSNGEQAIRVRRP